MLFLIKLVQFSKKKLNETTLKGLSCATRGAATSKLQNPNQHWPLLPGRRNYIFLF